MSSFNLSFTIRCSGTSSYLIGIQSDFVPGKTIVWPVNWEYCSKKWVLERFSNLFTSYRFVFLWFCFEPATSHYSIPSSTLQLLQLTLTQLHTDLLLFSSVSGWQGNPRNWLQQVNTMLMNSLSAPWMEFTQLSSLRGKEFPRLEVYLNGHTNLHLLQHRHWQIKTLNLHLLSKMVVIIWMESLLQNLNLVHVQSIEPFQALFNPKSLVLLVVYLLLLWIPSWTWVWI